MRCILDKIIRICYSYRGWLVVSVFRKEKIRKVRLQALGWGLKISVLRYFTRHFGHGCNLQLLLLCESAKASTNLPKQLLLNMHVSKRKHKEEQV